MKRTKLLACLCILALAVSLLAGCGGQSSQSGAPATATEAPAAGTAAPAEEPRETPYFPLVDELTEMSMWVSVPPPISARYESYNDMDVFKEYESWTNVHLEFTQVSSQAGAEQFNIMVSSGAYTDMVLMLAGRYAGGASSALADGIIYDLTDYIGEYAPDYLSYIQADQALYKDCITDDGRMLAIYGIMKSAFTDSGLVVRQDWLDELGLEAPATYDEMAMVLEAFKVNYDCYMPILVDERGLLGEYGQFIGGYGTIGFLVNAPTDRYSGSEFYQVDGTVQCSFLDDSLRDFLDMVSDWYAAGYFNSDWTNIMSFPGAWQQYISDDSAGIYYSTSSLVNTAYATNPDENFALTPLAEPVLEEGQISHFKNSSSLRSSTVSISVTTACEDPVLAVRWINGLFTGDGVLLANYGVQGIHWDYDSAGNPTFTELITKDESGAAYSDLMQAYTLQQDWPTYKCDSLYTLYSEDMMALVDFWSGAADGSYLLPRGLVLTGEESASFAEIAADLETYASENMAQFLTGQKDVAAEWDGFKAQIAEMNIDACIAIYQAALDRYNER